MGPGGGPTLGPMLKSLQRGPKRGVRIPCTHPGSAHAVDVVDVSEVDSYLEKLVFHDSQLTLVHVLAVGVRLIPSFLTVTQQVPHPIARGLLATVTCVSYKAINRINSTDVVMTVYDIFEVCYQPGWRSQPAAHAPNINFSRCPS